MTDEGVREIQLNGKQLVFLFMAGTVVSVVIFLCGVMVGRGVRHPRADLVSAEGTLDPTASSLPSPSLVSADRLPVSTQEELTYAERLEAPVPPPEALKDPVLMASAPAEPAPVGDTAPADPGPSDAPVRAERVVESPVTAPEPPGNGFAVQVGAYPRTTADVIAKGLMAKGFPAFVSARDRGLFAVRVGKYSDRREAEAVARRLERDEQFNKPWITR